MAALALPWFVLTSTGSAAQTGLVVACEFGPYIVAKALSGPFVDRWGQRRVSIVADLGSALAFGVIPALFALGVLPVPVLLIMVALGGSLRGPGDNAKDTSVPLVAIGAEVPLERVTGLYGADRPRHRTGRSRSGGGLDRRDRGSRQHRDHRGLLRRCALIWLLIMPGELGLPGAASGRTATWPSSAKGGRFLIKDRLLLTCH